MVLFYITNESIEEAKKLAGQVRDEVARLHPFDIPCIIKLNAESNEKYLRWIETELR